MFAKLRNEVRRPAVAGDFYPSGAQELEEHRRGTALTSEEKKRTEGPLRGGDAACRLSLFGANSGRGLFASHSLE